MMRNKYVVWSLVVALVLSSLAFSAAPHGAATAAGGPNLALGKSVTASGQSQTYAPSHVQDGNPATYWESTNQAFPQWITVDLGASTSIDQVVLKLPSNWETRTQTLSVQGSSNGSSFANIVGSAGYTFNPAVAGNSVTINFAASTTRYVRIVVMANTGWPAAQLSEFEIYGSGATPTPTPSATPTATPNGGTYQAESAALSGGAKTNNDHAGYAGSGFVDGYWTQGATTTFTVSAAASGHYAVSLKYANASGSAKTVSLYVNGTKIRQSTLANLANWDIWSQKEEVLLLNAGSNTIAYKYDPGDSGNINLDQISVTASTTPTPTVTPTPTPTPTATPSPTPTATPTPTLTPTPTSTPAGGNIAIGKPISASSSIFSFTASNANDNNAETYWEGGGQPASLTLDLGANHQVSSIVLKLNPATVWSTRTQTIQVLGHDQSTTTFGNLSSAQSYTFNPATGNSVTIPLTTTAKRLQLIISNNSGAPAGQIAEFQVFGTPSPNPDLVVAGLSWTPANPIESNAISFSATVRNNGSSGSGATTVGFYLGSELAGSAPVGALAAGASTTVAFNAGTRAAGTYAISAKVDESNSVIEQNEANNGHVSPSSLVVAPVASSDLVGTVSWTPATPVVGNAVSFTVQLKNQGNQSSAAGAHGVTLLVKNQAGSTLQTFNATYNGTIAAGAIVNVNLPGTWTATSGSYTAALSVAADGNELPVKQTNNNSSTGLSVYSARGASMPYARYDTDDASRGGGAALMTAPTFDQALTASEASGQTYISLPSNGSYAQWTVRQGEGGAGVTMRFTMPDSANGMGLNGSLDVYVNGTKAKTVSLTSYYSWQYFSSDHPADAPGGGRPLFRFDEVHWKLDTPLAPGDVIRIQKSNADTLEYGVDFLEIEPVPTAIPRPANAVSVTDHGAIANDGVDDLPSFKAAVTAAVAAGKTLYIPEGTFHLGNMWEIGSASNMINDINILGAGIWHTNIQFTNPNAASGGISFRVQGKLDFGHIYMNSNLRSRYNQQAVYKAFMDNFGTNSKVHNVWVEHFECGFWVGDYAHVPAIIATGLVIENSRIRNNLADGVNFAQGTSNSTVRNSSLRNNGDDALAVWTSDVNGAPAGVGNTFSYNTIENNWRAAAIAFFGGGGHKATHNLIIDTVGGSGIRMNTVFPGYAFQNNTGILFSDTTIINSGTSQDLYNGERGAIDLEASNSSIKNVTFTNIEILNTQRSAIQFGYGGGFENIVFNNININGTGRDGVTTSRFSSPHPGAAIYTYTGNGSATFNNLTTSNVAHPNTHFVQNGFGLVIQ
jgi:hypothetical protein